MNKSMSLRQKVLLSDGLMGCVWIGLCAIKFWGLVNSIKNIVLGIVLIVIIVSVVSMYCKSDKEDEMSKLNMMKAESGTYKLLRCIMVIALLFTFGNENITLDSNIIFPILFGITLIIKAILFIYYEKHGV